MKRSATRIPNRNHRVGRDIGAARAIAALKRTVDSTARPTSSRDTLHARVYAAMKQALMRGVYKPGQKITIRAVAAELGTSATPVREAIRRLAAEGAFEHMRSGTARLPAIDEKRLWEITQVRVALETLAARHAALRMTPVCIRQLEEVQRQLAAARDRQDYQTYLMWNEAFHFGYYRASGMHNLIRAIEAMWLQSGPYLTLLLPTMRGIDLHDAALDAARRRDADGAAEAIREDITRASQHLRTLIVSTPGEPKPAKSASRRKPPPISDSPEFRSKVRRRP